MKVSEITNELVAGYLRLDFASLTTAEKAELTALLGVSKAFIRSYTGIQDRTVTSEDIGTGDGETKVFRTGFPVIPETEKVYVDGTEVTTGITLIDEHGEITFSTAPEKNTEITADYQTGLDAYEDFVIVVYILCQDMYDNRAYAVDKTNMNHVVETILGMHCINLL